MTDKNRFEIARKLQGFSKSNLHGALSDVLVDRIQENPTCPKESLIDSEIFGFEVPLVTGQVMDCSLDSVIIVRYCTLYEKGNSFSYTYVAMTFVIWDVIVIFYEFHAGNTLPKTTL